MTAFSRRSLTPLVLLVALVVAVALPAAGQEFPQRPAPAAPPPWDTAAAEAAGAAFADDLWFVEFPSAAGPARDAHARERARFAGEAAARGISYDVRRDFTRLWNGLSVRATPGAAGRLATLGSVAAVYPVELVSIPDTAGPGPQLSTALAMTGADVARSELGLTGTGVSVAVMDTGVDYQHPDLGGDGPGTAFPTARVTHGFDFVGDEFNAGSDDPARRVPQPDPDPQDPNGHGTHVAGIVGAGAASADGVSGVAPDVTFGAYKVFGREGSTTADIMIKAMELALADGMDVLNMSIGSAFTWPAYPTATASDALVAAGMVVVASIGNSGADGVYSAGAPGLGADVIGVASADNTFIRANSFDLGDEQIPWLVLSGADEPPVEGTSAPLQLVGNHGVVEADGTVVEPGDATSLGCAASDFDGFAAGNVAVVMRGECRFDAKHTNALDAGASGVVIYNNVAGLFAGGGDFRSGAWGVGTSDTHGRLIVGAVKNAGGDVTVEFSDERVEAPNPTGGLVSSFSSYGLSPDLTLKPDILAPGGLITSTYPLALGEYATISGTSMSSPHVAGAAALLMQAHPDLGADAFRDRLQNTAEPAPWSLNPGLGLADHTYRQGAGMVQVDRAVLATTGVTPGKLSLGAGTAAHAATLTLTNWGAEDVTYSVSHVDALQTAGSTYAPGFFLAAAGFDGPDRVTVTAGDSVDVDLTITPPDAGLANHQYGGYVVLSPAEGTEAATLRVPYGGFAGDYQSLPLFGHVTSAGGDVEAVEPRLSRITVDGLEPVGDDRTFRARQGDHPVVEAFLGHHAQRLELVVHDLRADRSWTVHSEQHLRRSPGPGTYRPFAWDGTVPAGSSGADRPAPQGTYELELRVLKALGDAGNPEHWESWRSGAFELATRPGR